MRFWFNIIPTLILEYLLIIYKQIESVFKPNPPIGWLTGDRGAILLIQGLHESWVFLEKIGDYLNQRGYKVFTIPKLKTNTMPVLEAVAICKQFIEKQNLTSLIIIAHSKGGVVARYLFRDSIIANRIDSVISIATPYKGSRLVAILPNAHDLSPYSPIIKAIQNPMPEDTKTYNFYPAFDNHVMPNCNLTIPSIYNKQIDVIGHTRILESKDVCWKILKKIDCHMLGS